MLDSNAKGLRRSPSVRLTIDAKPYSPSTGLEFLSTGMYVLTAGFPCQDLSVAGKREGLEGSRSSLMYEPAWVVVENVHHSWKRWVPELRRQFHERGYASLPLHVSAVEVGARHPRRRVYVVAHSDSEQLRKLSWWWQWKGRQVADELTQSWDSAPRGLETADGLRTWAHRRHGLGNAVVPNAAQLVARAISELY